MDVAFCVEALRAALARFGRPEMFNPDQGSEFTSADLTDVLRRAQVLREAHVRILMGGRGRWTDEMLIERLWRRLKYGRVHLPTFETGSELPAGLTRWVGFSTPAYPIRPWPGARPTKRMGSMDGRD